MLDFPLLDDVIALTSISLATPNIARRVQLLTEGMSGLLGTRHTLPDTFFVPDLERYRRHLLVNGEADGYQVLLMTWGPGQGTDIHDHGGTWGVESVLYGALEITDYAVEDNDGNCAELSVARRRTLEAGQSLGLVPPRDLHACRNASKRDVAVSLHVYGEAVDHVRTFQPTSHAQYRVVQHSPVVA
ncbi:MAG: cysteine dioxygenase family protein [Pseudoxanthomonas sp.]